MTAQHILGNPSLQRLSAGGGGCQPTMELEVGAGRRVRGAARTKYAHGAC
ncbi:hypothetical protein SAY86_030394 [Trapa natans]|uniref:Uncharacterized protein n=1 Tax=Trapa natans TaxID=22666 RepID=A0AAN7MRK4_TRANT|nr:hypothetical protein SAY86_030394 [Trapa natans]